MVDRSEVCLKSRVWELSLEVFLAVENNSLEVGGEDWVYEPGVGDKVERSGESNKQWR